MSDRYFGIEEDGTAGMVSVAIERYRELLEIETRVAVAIEYIEANDPFYDTTALAKLLGAEIGDK